MNDETDDLGRTEIIERYLQAGDYQQAEAFAQSLDEGHWQKAESLAQVARAFALAEKLDDARRVWEKAIPLARAGENTRPQDSIDSSSVLWEIAEDMATAGFHEEAQKLAESIKNPGKRMRALQNVEDIREGERGSFYWLRQTESPGYNIKISHSSEDTFEWARRIGAGLNTRTVFLLSGDLGAGKTVFAKGVAAGLGIDPVEVTSPSFTLINEYDGRLRLYHIDLYRLEAGAFRELGLDEIFADPRAVTIIEWAERLTELPDAATRITIEYVTDTERRIRIEAVESAA